MQHLLSPASQLSSASQLSKAAQPRPLPGGAFLPPPELPTPNAQEVAEFQRLFLTRFSVELSEEEAHDQARRLVQFVFLMQHALPYLKETQNLDETQNEQKNQKQNEQEK